VCPEAARFHVAWKTGTSSGHRDAWCAAVTRRYTVVVWLGNARGQGSSALVGAEAAAPLALRLIASLGAGSPDPQPWPVADEPVQATVKRGPGKSARPFAGGTLALVSPVSGQQFLIDPAAPPDRQRVLLKAMLKSDMPVTGADSRTLWWFVDDQPIGVADPAAQLWWSPTAGAHEVRVVDAHGHAATAQIVVR
jgi:penicillin-binding protein 1C